MQKKAPAPPIAAKHPETVTHHGHTRTDDYAWLRAENWQEVMRDPSVLAPEIRAYLEAENAYFEARMADTEALQEALFQEMRGRIKEDDSSVPAPDGPWAYAVRYVEDGQHPLFVREKREGGDEHVLLDGNALAGGRAYFRLGGAVHSPDHKHLAWSHDDAGSEFYTMSIRDIESGYDITDTIADTSGGCVWSADGRHIFYVRQDANHRPSRVFRHHLGTSPEDDVLVYEEADPGFFVHVGKTQSDRFIVIHSHDHQTAEVCLDPGRPAGGRAKPRRRSRAGGGIRPRRGERHALHPHQCRQRLEGAEDFKIVAAPVASPGRESWTDIVPHQPGRLILSHGVTARHLVRLERVDGLPRIVIRRLADDEEHVIAFEEEAYSLGLSGGYEFDTNALRFTYSSMTTPARTYDYDMETRQRVLRKEQEVPSGHDPALYVTRRVFAPAADGETVPVSLLYRKDTPLDGSAPCYLYGYGSYGITIPAAFSVTRLSLVDRGFVHAIAHVRGGKAKGQAWYEAGKRQDKMNTFTDFIAAARVSVQRALHRARKNRRRGRLRRRHADGRRRQHGRRPVRRHHRQRALRRRAQHHARRHAAADAAGMAGMGQSHRERRGLRDDQRLLALRQRRRQSPTRRSWRSPVSPTRASPTGSRPNGWRGCVRPRRTATCSCCAPTWRPGMRAPRGVSTR